MESFKEAGLLDSLSQLLAPFSIKPLIFSPLSSKTIVPIQLAKAWLSVISIEMNALSVRKYHHENAYSFRREKTFESSFKRKSEKEKHSYASLELSHEL